jgi:hypothetical protein
MATIPGDGPPSVQHAKREFLDASLVPLEKALLARAYEIEKAFGEKAEPNLLDSASLNVAADFRSLAEKLRRR